MILRNRSPLGTMNSRDMKQRISFGVCSLHGSQQQVNVKHETNSMTPKQMQEEGTKAHPLEPF